MMEIQRNSKDNRKLFELIETQKRTEANHKLKQTNRSGLHTLRTFMEENR